MDEQKHHQDIIGGLKKEFGPILEGSSQAVYGYLDDNHMFCNDKFAKLMGYKSADEWAKAGVGSFLDAFVEEKSKDRLREAFMKATGNMAGSMTAVTWKKKDGATFEAQVILVPMPFQKHLFALHFIVS
jgi:hypothetical protein